MLETFEAGDNRCTVLIDGTRQVSPRFVFRGYTDEVHGPFVRPFLDDEGMLPGRYGCLLIETREAHVLVDAGIGRFAGDRDGGHLLEQLARLGVRPWDVRAVVVTHGHADHVGGLTDPRGNPVFREARHVVHVREAAYWASEAAAELPNDAAAPARAAFDALLEADLLDQVEGGGRVVEGVELLEAPGHTPGHLAVVVGGDLLWAGDAIVASLNVTHPEWTNAADMDGPASEAMRRALLAKAANENLVLTGSHLHGSLRVRRDDGGFAPE
jgi:glyoxylase-like metal-dependent hydrolase (beta-lactamase superfamily II)